MSAPQTITELNVGSTPILGETRARTIAPFWPREKLNKVKLKVTLSTKTDPLASRTTFSLLTEEEEEEEEERHKEEEFTSNQWPPEQPMGRNLFFPRPSFTDTELWSFARESEQHRRERGIGANSSHHNKKSSNPFGVIGQRRNSDQERATSEMSSSSSHSQSTSCPTQYSQTTNIIPSQPIQSLPINTPNNTSTKIAPPKNLNPQAASFTPNDQQAARLKGESSNPPNIVITQTPAVVCGSMYPIEPARLSDNSQESQSPQEPVDYRTPETDVSGVSRSQSALYPNLSPPNLPKYTAPHGRFVPPPGWSSASGLAHVQPRLDLGLNQVMIGLHDDKGKLHELPFEFWKSHIDMHVASRDQRVITFKPSRIVIKFSFYATDSTNVQYMIHPSEKYPFRETANQTSTWVEHQAVVSLGRDVWRRLMDFDMFEEPRFYFRKIWTEFELDKEPQNYKTGHTDRRKKLSNSATRHIRRKKESENSITVKLE